MQNAKALDAAVAQVKTVPLDTASCKVFLYVLHYGMTNQEARAFNKLKSLIKQKCMDCSGGKIGEVKMCPLVPVYAKRTLVKGCPLWPYRLGEPTEKDNRKLKRTRSAYEKAQKAVG